eukprot:scaffold570257_cov25-Prasinocladus_malaysianus.AAC.1
MVGGAAAAALGWAATEAVARVGRAGDEDDSGKDDVRGVEGGDGALAAAAHEFSPCKRKPQPP